MITRAGEIPTDQQCRLATEDEVNGRDHATRHTTEPTVIHCYDVIDQILPECGIVDLTEGMYFGDSSTPYDVAQQNQINWLLDQVQCGPGSRLLDIGCGNGTLLDSAQRRGARAVGVTVSPQQADRCRRRELDVHVLNYRELDGTWDAHFDCIVANGSMEHFVQPRDAALGRQDAIYQHFFETCHRLIDPRSASGRLAATVIHFDHFRPSPHELMRSPFCYLPWTKRFHMALLERVMGGYYPTDDQLVRCAAPCFDLSVEQDGTEDYRFTSEEWLRRVRRGLLSPRTGPRLLRRLMPCIWKRPRHTLLALSLAFTASWQWQFRSRTPPTILRRLVWHSSNARDVGIRR